MRKRLFLLALLSTSLLTACIFDDEDEEWDATKVCPESKRGTFTDDRDGQVYKYTTIGNQVWMAQNLNYDVEHDACYYEDDDCRVMGRVYSSDYLVECPAGWHVASWSEWKKLFDNMDGMDVAGKKLKSTSGWSELNPEDKPNGTDDCGFSVVSTINGSDNRGFRSVYLTSTNDEWLHSTCCAPIFVTFQSYQPILTADNSVFGNVNGYIRCVKD